jgi:hypothetical protein
VQRLCTAALLGPVEDEVFGQAAAYSLLIASPGQSWSELLLTHCKSTSQVGFPLTDFRLG